MRYKKIAVVVASVAASMTAFVGCDYTSYFDYFDATVNVKANNGTSPVVNLPVEYYDWVLKYNDGSQVAYEFTNANFVTGNTGAFSFRSEELGLQSGELHQGSCGWVCTLTLRQDVFYCWEYDDFGTCIDGEWRTVESCVDGYEDCDYYYPVRHVSDITKAYGEITYYWNNSLVSTPSENYTTPVTAYSSTQSVNGDETRVTMTWTQFDTFVTPYPAPSAAKARPSKPILTRTPTVKHKSSEYSELSVEQKTKLEAVRAMWGEPRLKH